MFSVSTKYLTETGYTAMIGILPMQVYNVMH